VCLFEQVHASAEQLRLITFDADGTLYADGAHMAQDNRMIRVGQRPAFPPEHVPGYLVICEGEQAPPQAMPGDVLAANGTATWLGPECWTPDTA